MKRTIRFASLIVIVVSAAASFAQANPNEWTDVRLADRRQKVLGPIRW
jgi:hypothetical protein